MEVELRELSVTGKADLPIDDIVEKLMSVADNAFADLCSSNPQKAKDALRVLIQQVTVDPEARKAIFYVSEIPQTPKDYAPNLPVTLCRRSDLNRHDIAIAGF